MAVYMFRDERGDVLRNAHDLGMPTPVHALRESSLAAVESMRQAGLARRVDRLMAKITRDVGRPPADEVETWLVTPQRRWRIGGKMVTVITGAPYAPDPITDAARRLMALAEEVGFEVKLLSGVSWCRVEGLRREERCGFRATWTEGAADIATWHEPWRYELIEDTRTVAVDQKARVGKAGHRSPGVGVERLSIVASPWGVPIGVTALTARLKGYRA